MKKMTYHPGFRERLETYSKGEQILVKTGDLPSEKPEWFNEKKFKAGQRLVKKYYGGVLLAHLLSLIMLLFSPSVLKPLIFTGKSETPKKAYRRYIATTVHVMSWYRGNVWREGSRARESLRRVRNYHSDAALTMNSPMVKPLVDQVGIAQCGPRVDGGKPLRYAMERDLGAINNCPHVLPDQLNWSPSSSTLYLNQYDMIGTQFAFVAMIVLYPQKFGLARATDEELEGFIHFWRCIGYLLGIEDRFNFCSDDDLPTFRAFTSDYMEQVVKPAMKMSVSPEYEHMGRVVAMGANNYLPSTYESSYLYITDVIQVPVAQVTKRVSFLDRLRFYLLVFLFQWVGNLPMGNNFLNSAVQFSVTQIVSPPKGSRVKLPPVKGLSQLWNNPEG